MKIYLDNCCFNRPYDDQSYMNISLETQAKLMIQSLIKENKFDLASSFILEYENSCNPYKDRKDSIQNFLNENVKEYIGSDKADSVIQEAQEIMKTGVKMKDSCHIVCAQMLKCDYLITTDTRMIKYKDGSTKIVNPLEFINLIYGGSEND